MPDDLLLAQPGLVVSILDRLAMTRCVRVRGHVLALFCEGPIVENYNDCGAAKSPLLGDITGRFGLMMSEPGSISTRWATINPAWSQ